MTEPPAWHCLTPEETLQELDSQASGLAGAEAQARLARYGPNTLARETGSQWFNVLAAQFRSVLLLILVLASALSFFLGDWIEGVAILAIVAMTVVLGFVQEFRAERALAALRKMTAPAASVCRDGEVIRVPAAELVPGDVVVLTAGDIVPADARLMDSANIQADESVLTGESLPVAKQLDALAERELAVADRSNMVFSGTAVTYGRGRGVVVATGMSAEFGKVAGLVKDIRGDRTPLQQQLNRVARVLGIAALLVVLMITLLGLQQSRGLFEMFLFGIALAVAVVPEALPAVVTISLALGVQRMARRHALVRHLPAVETLGSTSVICADKTGTLTRNQMTARSLYTGAQRVEVSGSGYAPEGTFRVESGALESEAALRELLQAGVLSSDAELVREDHGWHVRGDPTEGALVACAAKAGLHRESLIERCPRIAEVPFESATKRMMTLHDRDGGRVAFVKGAPEVVLSSSSSWLTRDGQTSTMDAEARENIEAAARDMAAAGLRVIALAEREGVTLEQCGEELIFLGLVGMSDPPRPEAREAIARCTASGIRPVMITGDHPDTARAIAGELGMLGEGRIMTGKELQGIGEDELRSQIREIDIFARVDPQHKLRVVEAWQAQGEVVAMTGDGVNDAPALKRADVGVAMGLRGTDVSRAAAAMTLTDDNFASIVGAVEEGRMIFANIRKYLTYLLSSNIGEIGLIALASLAGMPLPLTAVQILYINLATDGFPALALSVDPPSEDLMKYPPRSRAEGVFSRRTVTLMLVGGIWSTIANLSLFSWALASGRALAEAMTMTFVSLVLIQFFKAYSFRSVSRSVFHRPFANRWLNLAIVWELVLLSLIVYVPFLHEPFGTYALSGEDWLIVILVALTIIPVLEFARHLAGGRGPARGV